MCGFKYDVGYTKKDEVNDLTIVERLKRLEYKENKNIYENHYYYICKCNKCGEKDIWITSCRFNSSICPNCSKGLKRLKNNYNKYMGKIYKLNCGATAQIIEYRRNVNVDIKIIENGEIIKNVSCGGLKNGSVKPKYYPILYGVGYIGDEVVRDTKNDKTYICWANMLKRCYCVKNYVSDTTYVDVEVCKEWHNFTNFKKWYANNYYDFREERTDLDKDILVKGNKIYSPDTCIFVPRYINRYFPNRLNFRGEYPLGVQKKGNRYISTISINNKNTHLGMFKTPEEAFFKYKKVKEDQIKRIADECKNDIPLKLYNALYDWEVDIMD